MEALERLFADMRDALITAVHFAGPWALPALGLIALILAITFRDRIVSPAGLITILALAAFAVTIRAVQLGRF